MKLSIPLCLLLTATCCHAAGIGEVVQPLNGSWLFRTDPTDQGVQADWAAAKDGFQGWDKVNVPHTWQVTPGLENHYGLAWYARVIPTGTPEFRGKALRLEFDAVNRDAIVWINGRRAGEHTGSGYTAFSIPVPESAWNFEGTNVVVLRVDNRFSTNAFPYERSFDWPQDGGIIRQVRLRAEPLIRLAPLRVSVDVAVSLDRAVLAFPIGLLGSGGGSGAESTGRWQARIDVFDPDGQRVEGSEVDLNLGSSTKPPRWAGEIVNPQLWHFDAPRLYRVHARLLHDGRTVHEQSARIGLRRLEVKPGRFVLNGEPMRLMGVEWMPGSDPRHGLAEDPGIAREILSDMKRLNCILTRFHWQQDPALFDFCDEEGMLVQEEIPVWGKHPLRGERFERLQDQHLEEMIWPHFNHPSIFSWGLCNEIKAGSDEGRDFVRRGMEQTRKLDPTRLASYASNTLQPKPSPDAAGLTDIIEWNEYYGTWYMGGASNVGPMLDKIQAAFPGKGVLISEYGLCECDPKNPEGDDTRIEFLRSHTDAYRAHPAVAGAIYFDYNDYRTHMGDKGQGSFQQRVHGVVDLMRHRKPSWEALRRECSPVRQLEIIPAGSSPGSPETRVRIVTRSLENDLPAYTLRGYIVVWNVEDAKGLPKAAGKALLPDLAPGSVHEHTLGTLVPPPGGRIAAEVFRPTGYSVIDAEWRGSR
jgi:beta-glucuronidase